MLLLVVTWTEKTTGEPIDITGATASMTLRTSLYAAASLTVGGTVNGAAGQVTLSFTDDQTDDLIDGEIGYTEYLWDCRLVLAGGNIKTIAGGLCTVKEAQTR